MADDQRGKGELHFRIFQEAGGKWRWRLIAANGTVVCESAEAYDHRLHLSWGMSQVRQSQNAPSYEPPVD